MNLTGLQHNGGGSSGGGTGSGWIMITDITPTSSGSVGGKTYLTAQNVILQTATGDATDLTVAVEASGPKVNVEGVNGVLTRSGDESNFSGTVNITVSETTTVTARVYTPDDALAASDNCLYTLQTAPEVLTLSFTGGYPGSQTELKAGDTFQITGTTDVAAVAIVISNFGAFDADEIVVAGTSFTITGTIADRGTTVQALAARVAAKDSNGATGSTRDTNMGGGTTDGVDLINLNNLYPTIETFQQADVTYPASQEALKDSETATVDLVVTDYNTILYSSPNSDLSVSNTTTYEQAKTVTRIAGNYNIATTNYQIVATRTANDASSTRTGVVYIAHTAATLTVTEPATRLRSGGNNGTSAQSYTITITGSQNLISAPTLGIGAAGTWLGGGFAGSGTSWTRSLQVHDDDVKGTYAWGAISGTNLAGKVTSAFTGDSNYILGGFVSRDLTLAAFANTINMSVEVVTYVKLTISWSVKSLPNQRAVGTTAVPDANSWAIDALNTNPTEVIILDTSATDASSVPTTVTMEETV